MMTGGDETQENAEQHPKDKWYEHKANRITKAVAALVVYGLFIFLDIHDIWPWSRGWAVFAGVLATIALLYMEAFATEAIGFLAFLIISAAIVFVGLTIYARAPPIFPEETDTHGWLAPAGKSEPAQANIPSCPKLSVPNAVTVALGSNVALIPLQKTMRVLTVSSCGLVTAQNDDGKLSFNADVFDDKNDLIARVEKNEFHLVPGKYAYQTRSDDKSVLTVFDRQGKRMLSIRYLNSTTIRLSGAFYCGDGTSVIVEDDGPITLNSRAFSNAKIGGNCSANTGGIFINPNSMGL